MTQPDKVSRILAKTEANGCTPAEVRNAKAVARRILTTTAVEEAENEYQPTTGETIACIISTFCRVPHIASIPFLVVAGLCWLTRATFNWHSGAGTLLGLLLIAGTGAFASGIWEGAKQTIRESN